MAEIWQAFVSLYCLAAQLASGWGKNLAAPWAFAGFQEKILVFPRLGVAAEGHKCYNTTKYHC